MMELVFATNNKNKLREAEAILPPTILLLNLDDVGVNDDIPETENTFSGNALLKARYVKNKSDFHCFADDSGLEVMALNGAPGVFSARYSGEDANSQNNIEKLLKELDNETNRGARFVTVIALTLDNNEYLFEGSIAGVITMEPKGNSGFGYDPIFIPEGYTQTFAEMSPLEKNKISHRAIALKKMSDFLNERLNP